MRTVGEWMDPLGRTEREVHGPGTGAQSVSRRFDSGRVGMAYPVLPVFYRDLQELVLRISKSVQLVLRKFSLAWLV